MKRKLVGAVVLLLAAALDAQDSQPLGPPALEEASSVAVHTADALARGRSFLLREVLDELSIVGSAVGPSFLPGLTARQTRQIADRLLVEIAGPFTVARHPKDFTHVLAAGGRNGQAIVTLLMPSASGDLKTDWRLRLRHGEWRVEDIVLSDTGRSIRQEAIESLGSPPIARWRQRDAEAKRAAWPRAAGVVAVLLATLVFFRNLRGSQRWVLLAIAAVPAILFAVDGWLAVTQVWNEPVEVRLAETTPRNRILHRFQTAVSAHDADTARKAASEAVAAGAAPAPLHFVLGHLAEESGRFPEAAREYEFSLSGPSPAPGGWAGLARIAFAAGKYRESAEHWDRYFSATAPDPTSLVLKAAALGRDGDTPAAQVSLEKAIAIDPARPEPYDLSSRIAAIQGDEAIAISRLREEEKLRSIDRAAIARDPTFSLLADKSAWKAFLAESPPKQRLPG